MIIVKLDTSIEEFGHAYYKCICDLNLSRGKKVPNRDTTDTTWFRDPRILALGTQHNGQISSFILFTKCTYFINNSSAEILDIWVDQENRRQKFGQALVIAVLNENLRNIGIQIHKSNMIAFNFWKNICNLTRYEMILVENEESDEMVFLLK